jgi:hypothetical protein
MESGDCAFDRRTLLGGQGIRVSIEVEAELTCAVMAFEQSRQRFRDTFTLTRGRVLTLVGHYGRSNTA